MNERHFYQVLKTFAFAMFASWLISFPGSLIADEKPEKAKPKITQTHLMMMNADGTGLKLLFKSEKYTRLRFPTYSHDGKRIAMGAWPTHLGENVSRGHIISINAEDGSDMIDVGEGLKPSWSADGKQFAFFKGGLFKGGVFTGGVWTMDTDGENRELIDSDGSAAQWSPDGTMIIYFGLNTGKGILTIYNTQEETYRFVFPFEKRPYTQYYWNACWSPDSKSLCFKGRSSQGNYELATVNVNKGLESLKVHFSDAKVEPEADMSWHPDGKQILCIYQSPKFTSRKIFSFNPLIDQAPVVMPGQTFSGMPVNICWSPDGRKYVFTMVVKP